MRTTAGPVAVLLFLASIGSGCAVPGIDDRAGQSSAEGLSYRLQARSVHTYFGNEIVITDLQGDSREFRPGATYLVRGRYNLQSHQEAVLAQWCANGWVQETPSTDPQLQHGGSLRVKRGQGEFSFRFKVKEVGDLHLSFYPAGGGPAFASLYYVPTLP